jgi:3D (Asp-Asp-Asp) domain-containing protein
MLVPRSLQPTLIAVALATLPLAACATTPAMESLIVTASAYNSVPGQTNHHPNVAAWGDRLEPGMKAIAVSPDLLDAGLARGSRVRIDGLPGEYVVLDRMPDRWEKHIDIYMGDDVPAALHWGVRDVRIHWVPVKD